MDTGCTSALCERRFEDVERRVTALEQDTFKQEIWKAITEIKVSVANLNGRMAGYLVAGGVLGAGLSMALQYMLKK